MTDIPNTRFINLVDPPASIQYSQYGDALVQLDPSVGSIINVTEFRRVSILIGLTTAQSGEIYIGKISGPTLSQRYDLPLDGNIHTFDVVGPEMCLWLRGGQPNSQESVQLWVELGSQEM